MNETQPAQNLATRGDRPRVLVNTYDQLKMAVRAGLISKSEAVAVSYYSGDKWHTNGTKIFSPFFHTDPKAHWTNNGHKTFSGNRSISFPKAKQWASEAFGIKSWLPNRMRDHVPAIVQKSFPIPNPEASLVSAHKTKSVESKENQNK